MLFAAATVAALLVASPSVSTADHIAADGEFLLGNAHRCGVASERIDRARQLIRGLIVAANDGDDHGAEADSMNRFNEFFMISALPADRPDEPVASCDAVAGELARLERHTFGTAPAGE